MSRLFTFIPMLSAAAYAAMTGQAGVSPNTAGLSPLLPEPSSGHPSIFQFRYEPEAKLI